MALTTRAGRGEGRGVLHGATPAAAAANARLGQERGALTVLPLCTAGEGAGEMG